jgi:hypothetical protein
MATTLAATARTEVARPLKVLVPLINDELEAGDSAGIEHYRRAGEMLLEAKDQVGHGEWGGWVKRNFPHRSRVTVNDYMKLVNIPQKKGMPFISIRQALGRSRPGAGAATWSRPVQQITSRVNMEALAKEQQNREREAALLHKLGHQLIDIGYKVLSSKLHPDKGGSSEAMARLNKVRSILREAI